MPAMHATISSRWWRWLFAAAALAPAAIALSATPQPPSATEPVPPKYSELSFVSGGEKIKVGQYSPGEGQGPFPGIILLHGLDGLDLLKTNLQVQFLYGTLANRIARHGYVVHFVHYFHRTPLKTDDIPKVKEQLQKHLADSNNKLDPKLVQYYRDWLDTTVDGYKFLQSQKDVDKNNVGILGLSLGGFVGTSVVVMHPELKVTVLGNLFGGLAPGQSELILKNKLKLPPLLIMSAQQDDVVPEKYQQELFLLWRGTGSPAEAHFYADFGHAFYDKRTKSYDQNMALNEALPTALRFFKRHLQEK
jgi:dienelactone hydrolase